MDKGVAMLEIAIPDADVLRLDYPVADFNGTLAEDGIRLPGVAVIEADGVAAPGIGAVPGLLLNPARLVATLRT
jgi:hypothetical protein